MGKQSRVAAHGLRGCHGGDRQPPVHLVDSLWGLYLFCTIGGVGVAGVYVACMGLVLKWFPDRRGLATGLATGAYGSGAALTVVPIRRLIQGAGYQTAFIVTFGGLMVSAQLKPIAVAHGIDMVSILPGVDALSFTLMANLIVAVLARPFWGWLSDRIGRYSTMAIAFTLGGMAILGLLELVRAPWGFAFFSCLTTFTWGASFVLFSSAIGDTFGSAYAATNNGIHYTSKGVAAIFAGWGAARVVEATGTWAPVFWLGVVCNLVAAAIVLFVLRPMIARVVGQSVGRTPARSAG